MVDSESENEHGVVLRSVIGMLSRLLSGEAGLDEEKLREVINSEFDDTFVEGLVSVIISQQSNVFECHELVTKVFQLMANALKLSPQLGEKFHGANILKALQVFFDVEESTNQHFSTASSWLHSSEKVQTSRQSLIAAVRLIVSLIPDVSIVNLTENELFKVERSHLRRFINLVQPVTFEITERCLEDHELSRLCMKALRRISTWLMQAT